MRLNTFGHPVVCYGPEGAGSEPAPSDPGAQPPAQQITAPWEGVTDGPWKLGEGEAAKPWWDAIPEEPVRELMSQKAYKTPAEMAVAYYNANKLIGGSTHVIPLPGENATPEDMEAFYAKLGRPNTPSDYELKFEDGVQVDDGMVEFGKQVFHKIGLNNKQAQLLANEWNKFNAEQAQKWQEDFAKRNDEAVNALKASWGAEAEAHIQAGKRAYAALGLSTDTVNALEAHIGAAPVVELLAKLGKMAGEGKLTAGSQSDPSNPDTMDPQAAAAEIQRLNADQAFQKAYTGASEPGHKEAVERMNKLFARAGVYAPS